MTQKERDDGYKAELLLDNPVYIEAVTKVREAIITAWENAPIRDKDGHNELKLMLKLLKDLDANIKTVAQTGTLAKLQIERTKAERARSLLGV
jgi:hypothetical protein